MPTWSDIFIGAGVTEAPKTLETDVSVHFIDVGQGDCELIVTPECKVLIDCGEAEYAENVIAYLNALNIKKLDYIIASHPHSDHIGGMYKVLDNFKVGRLIMPDIDDELIPTTACYTKLISSAYENDVNTTTAVVDEVLYLGEDANIKIIAPVNDYEDLNNYSIVCKFTHDSNTFLFCGDIEKEAEDDILDSGADISAKVIKVPHHGSSTSSKKAFLKAVGGTYAVVEVGNDNSYNHPNDKVMKRYDAMNYKRLQTNIFGTIIFESDGVNLKISSERGEYAESVDDETEDVA